MVSRAWATQSSASRWRGLGTPARKLSTSCPTTSGAAPSSNGPTPPPPAAARARPRAATTRAGGRARARASTPAAPPRRPRHAGTPARRPARGCARRPRAAGRPTPDPAATPPPGPFLPATTTSARAGSAGTNCSRSQSSSPTAASNVSSSNTTGSRPPSASSGRLGGQPDRPPELGHERRWRRLDRAQVEAHDVDAGVRGRLGERAQQRGLAHPARTVYPQHAERRFRRRERPQEQLELRRASHEPPPPRTLQAVGHRRRRRGSYESCRAIGDIVCPSQPTRVGATALRV